MNTIVKHYKIVSKKKKKYLFPLNVLPANPPETDQRLTRNLNSFQQKQIKICHKACVLLADRFLSHIQKTHNFAWHLCTQRYFRGEDHDSRYQNIYDSGKRQLLSTQFQNSINILAISNLNLFYCNLRLLQLNLPPANRKIRLPPSLHQPFTF